MGMRLRAADRYHTDSHEFYWLPLLLIWIPVAL
jgi:hypothetical protein